VPGDLTPVDPEDVDLLAASLRADAGEVQTLTRVLLDTLGESLPNDMVEVERRRSMSDRVAGRDGVAVALTVRAGERQLVLRQGDRGPEAEIRQVVRGVVISRRPVAVDEWVRALAEELARLAASDAATGQALRGLLGG
jgi:hypothetical protein